MVFEIAESLRSFWSGNILAGAGHAAAAVQYGIVAKKSGAAKSATGGGAESKSDTASKAVESRQRERDREVETRFDITLHGIPVPERTARELMDALEGESRRRGRRLSA